MLKTRGGERGPYGSYVQKIPKKKLDLTIDKIVDKSMDNKFYDAFSEL